MSQGNTPPFVILTSKEDGLKEGVNLNNVARIIALPGGGSRIRFVGGVDGMEVQEAPDQIIPLYVQQSMALLMSKMDDMRKLAASIEELG